MATIVAEFYGGVKDGEVRALPALLPSWEFAAFSATEYLATGSIRAAKCTLFYDLERDENGDPKVYEGDFNYRYIYRKPE